MIDILIAEDQALVRQGLKMMLETEADFRVTGEAVNGQEAVECCKKNRYDLVLLDIRMPVMNGLEAGKKIRELLPDSTILMLTTFNDEEYALEALKNRANGYLLKDGDAEELIKSVKSALGGGLALEDHVAAKIMPTLLEQQKFTQKVDERLTDRELDLIALIGKGLSNQEISATLFLSVGTIKNQISGILHKLELRDRTQLAIYALNHDIQ
ncbi:response regulator [Marinilactibacillus piezotolerans]|uniref:response regulator n=1 Tax=Marinilactibacillus piezotolerans TaxID=258723 RepID=UPI0009B15B33|nr:response regulator transcription factor [Marinilactibacillus piezotolerans]